MVQTLLQLTVRDILKRPLFQKAETFASEEALNRTVRWVHIMEVTEVGHLLSGHELILTTGIGWQHSEELSLSFLRQLIDSGASGLCIELGAYAKAPLASMIELASGEHFPLIFFHEEVRYIDITQDLHAHFINQHHRMVAELESLSSELNQLLLSGKGLPPLLRLLHETTGAQVAFFPLSAEPQFLPDMPARQADDYYKQWISGELFAAPDSKKRIAHRPILALDHLFADLLLQTGQELSDFQILALDRCSTAIAQEMMRTNYMEEKRRLRDDRWVEDWLAGKHELPEIRRYLGSLHPGFRPHGCVICVFELEERAHESGDPETALIQRLMVARSVFDSEGFLMVSAMTNRRLVFALPDQLGGGGWKERLLRALRRLRGTEQRRDTAIFAASHGIGTYVRELNAVKESYETAMEAIAIQRQVGPLEAPLYDELHVYRIVDVLKAAGRLASLIDEYIGPVVAYDREKNGQLLRTLKVYLSLSGSKQETAKALFVVRQTLYHRLDKIESLLGADFMRPDKRLAIELAIYAYEYTNGAIT